MATTTLFACSDTTADGTGPVSNRAVAPSAPSIEQGMQFTMPDTIIPPREERMMCWIPEWVPDQDYFITHLDTYQGDIGGHHIVAMRSLIPRTPGSVFDCTQIETMTSLRPLVLPDPASDETTLLPDGFAVRLPRDSRIVMQSHYINTTDRDMVVADVATLRFLPADERDTFTEASYFIINAGDIALPQGEGSVMRDCVVEAPMNLMTIIGHMHELGTWIDVKQERGTTVTDVYSEEWNAHFRDLPPVEKYDPATPLVVNAGDRFELNCGYNNDRDHTVTFPEEMCTMVAYYFPARPEGLILCGD